MTSSDPDTLVLDACLVITFGNADALELVTGIEGYEVVIASRAIGEVRRPPASRSLRAALEERRIRSTAIDLSVAGEQDALARFDAMPAFRGRGDAEVLALAVSRGYAVGTDERAIRRVVKAELTPRHLVSTLDVLVLAVRQGRMSARKAVRLLERIDVGPAYAKRMKDAGLAFEDLR